MSPKLATVLACLVLSACSQTPETVNSPITTSHSYHYTSDFNDAYGNSYVYEDGFSHTHNNPAIVNGYLQGTQSGTIYSRRQHQAVQTQGE
ncbi:hypothetical protein DBZ36_03880 [Alginatibacterium sediminis]|uniref:Lipoprotein n=1 Tax=Alginatibacterium sediminis TaxID=2164068 RepID=A0A420EG27_9ALTE|nr:hypothetical protein [Alginatibacterium sediminis]RKF19614.1 hypothetical protein DBZ36_03880 [Alginatibacterium sediminis]